MKIAVVGGRSLQDDQLAIIYTIGYRMTKAGHTVGSGGAIGGDDAAERGARRAGGNPTILVPRGHARMHDPRTTVVVENEDLRDLARRFFVSHRSGDVINTFDTKPEYVQLLFIRNAAVAYEHDAAIGWQGNSGGTAHCFSCFGALGKPVLDLGEAFARNDFNGNWPLVIKRWLYRLQIHP